MFGLLFTYGVTLFGSLAALLNPFYGFLAYVCMAVLKPEHLWFYNVPQNNYSRVIGIAMLVGWVLHGFGDRKLGRGASAVIALLGFFVWSGMSATLAPVQQPAWAFVEALAKIVLPVLVGLTTIKSKRELKMLAWIIFLCQGMMAFEMNLYYLSGFNRLRTHGIAGLDNNAAAIALNAGIGLGFFLGLAARSLWQRGLAWFLCLMMVHAIMFSFSRGGLLGLCVVGGVAFFLIPRRPSHYVALAIALAVAARLAGPEVTERFMTVFVEKKKLDLSAVSRVQLWTACAKVAAANPLFGIGPNQWKIQAHLHGFEEGKAAHSTWFEMAAETGLVGVTLLLAFYWLTIIGLWRQNRRIRLYGGDPWAHASGCMVITSLMGFGVSAQFVTVEALEVPYYVALLGIATMKIYGRTLWENGAEPWAQEYYEEEPTPEPEPPQLVEAAV